MDMHRTAARLATVALMLAASVLSGRPAEAQPSSPAAIAVTVSCSSTANVFSLRVQGADFDPFTAVLVTFDAAAGGTPESFDTSTDGFGRFDTTIQPAARPAGTYVVRADDFREREATLGVAISCPGQAPPNRQPPPQVFNPTLSFHPGVTRRGFIVALSGTGFPPNQPVHLAWGDLFGRNIVSSVTADGSGSVSVARVLVFEETVVGTAHVVATPGGTDTFGAVAAPLLVVPGTVEPPQFKERR
jgi:hypothetical protein